MPIHMLNAHAKRAAVSGDPLLAAERRKSERT